jgi:Concanavalin A-like lectin/glucanases superfamily/Secretion system C-terminal sorting domain
MKKLLLYASVLGMCSIAQAQTVPAYISTNGLQAWYPFSGNANNAFGTGKNGSVLGPVLTTDRFGTANSAYHFNGSTDHVTIDTTFFNVGWSNFTVSLWLNSDSLDNPNNVNNNSSLFNTIPHNGICLVYGWMSTYLYRYYANQYPGVGAWNILPGVQSHSIITSHVWRHYVAVKKDDTAYSFYLNGVLDSSYHSSLLAPTHYCKIVLGNTDSTVGDFGFWGKLDDYGIWNRALAGCEIRRLFNSSPFSYITVQPVNVTGAPAGTVHFTVTDTGTGNTHQWQENSGTGYVNLTNTGIYSGVTTATLNLTGITSTMNNYKYRCIVANTTACVDTSDFGKLNIWTTGVMNANSSAKVSIAPNPTTGEINIAGAGKVGIKFYNSVGQLVKEVSSADKVSIAELPAAIYLIKLFDERGELIYYDKVIKQ